MNIIKKIIILVLLSGFFTFSYAFSQIKIICDSNGEKIYLNDEFKAECNKDDVVRLMTTDGQYTIKVKKEDKEAKYNYTESFVIGDRVQKLVEPHIKPTYNEYHYYKNSIRNNNLSSCNVYLKKYPNGKYVDEVNEIKSYLLAKKDFKFYKIYKQKYPNGKFLHKIKEYYKSNPLIATLRGHSKEVNAIALTKDENKLFSASDDEKIIEWDLRTNRKIKIFTYPHKPGGVISITSIALSPNEKYIYSDGRSVLRKWNIKTGKYTIIGKYSPEHIKVLDKNHILTLRGDRFDIWNVNTKKIIFTYLGNDGYDASMNACTLSKDKKYLYFSKYSEKLKREVIIKYNLRNKKIEKQFYAPELKYSIMSLAITPDNKYLISGTRNDNWVDEDNYLRKTVIIWDTESTSPVKTFKQKGNIYAIAIDQKGEKCAIGTSKGKIFIRDIKTGILIKKINAYSSINDLKFTNNGKKLIGALANGNIKIWYLGFYGKSNILNSLLKSCKKGDISSCKNYILRGGKNKRIAKNIILKRFKSILKSYGVRINYKNPKVAIFKSKKWKYFIKRNGIIANVDTIVYNNSKTYISINFYFKNAGYTFNTPIYFIKGNKKKNYSKKILNEYKIKIGYQHKKVIFIYDNFPIQRGKYQLIEGEKPIKSSINFQNINIIKLF